MSRFDLDHLISDLLRRIRILETTQPMGYSAVSEGRSRFAGNESVLVQGSGKVEGWWIVTGTQRVTGLLEGSGTLDWTGPCNLKGKVSVTGDTDFIGRLKTTGDVELGGDTVIKKNLDVQAKTRLRGETTLEADLKVLSGGKIQVGDMIIDPAGAGKITFANGTEVRAGEGGVTIANGVSNVTVAPGFTRIGVGGSAVYVDGTGIFLNTVPQVFHPDLPKGTLMRQGGRIVEVAG